MAPSRRTISSNDSCIGSGEYHRFPALQDGSRPTPVPHFATRKWFRYNADASAPPAQNSPPPCGSARSAPGTGGRIHPRRRYSPPAPAPPETAPRDTGGRSHPQPRWPSRYASHGEPPPRPRSGSSISTKGKSPTGVFSSRPRTATASTTSTGTPAALSRMPTPLPIFPKPNSSQRWDDSTPRPNACRPRIRPSPVPSAPSIRLIRLPSVLKQGLSQSA